jgi:hypothetical protein
MSQALHCSPKLIQPDHVAIYDNYTIFLMPMIDSDSSSPLASSHTIFHSNK